MRPRNRSLRRSSLLPPILETARLELRPFVTSDAEAVHVHLRQRRVGGAGAGRGGRSRRGDVLGHRIRRAAPGTAPGGVALDRERAARRAPCAAPRMAQDAGARGRRDGAGSVLPRDAAKRVRVLHSLDARGWSAGGVRRSDHPARRVRSHSHAVRPPARPRPRRQRRKRGNAVRANRGGLAPARAGGRAPPHRVDLDAAAARVRETGYPQADDFAAQHVLASPSESAMLDALTHASFPRDRP